MDWLTFVSKLTGDIAWPAAALGAVLILREPIRSLLALVSRVKVSSVEIEFDRKLELAKQEASSELRLTSLGHSRFPFAIDTQILKLAEVSPRAAVMEAWRHVEAAALRVAKSLVKDGTFTSETMTFRAIRLLERHGVLTDPIAELIRDLRSLRNDAAHASDFGLSTASAMEYFQLAAQVVGYLDGLAGSQGEDGGPEQSSTKRGTPRSIELS